MQVIAPEDFEKYSPLFRGVRGRRLAEFIMHLVAIDKINTVYNNSGLYRGPAFASHLLDDLGVRYTVGNASRLKQLQQGAFIAISNHPYGGLDGIILIDLLAGIRPDFRLMVNQLISLVRTMDENFISVTPTGNHKKGISAASIHGVRETLSSLSQGHPVGFFPSGAVSDLSLWERKIRDRKWQDSIIHVIRSARVPILPIRFFDRNSMFFYLLGLLNSRIRLLRMPWEVFNKRYKPVRLGIGELITVEEQKKYTDLPSLKAFLRKTVYGMALPAEFVSSGEIAQLLH